MEAAKENIDSLQNIVLDLETKIDLRDPEENMQKMQFVKFSVKSMKMSEKYVIVKDVLSLQV